MNLAFRICGLPILAFVLATSIPAQAKLAANGVTANSLESKQLAPNRLASNRLASNRLASNRLALHGTRTSQTAGDGAFTGLASIALPEQAQHR